MISDFFIGISTYKRAIEMISRHKLWSYIFWPGLISLFMGAAIFFAAIIFSSEIGHWLMSLYPDGWVLHDFFESVAAILSFIAILGIAILIFKYIIMTVVAPFMGPLSEKIESIQTGSPPPAFSMKNAGEDLIRGIRINLRNLIRELLYMIPLLLINLIPGLGTIVYTFAAYLLQSYFAGFGNMDPTLERRRFKVGDRISFVSANRGLAMGNGAVFIALIMVPVIGWFLAPAYGTISATLNVLDRLDRQKNQRLAS